MVTNAKLLKYAGRKILIEVEDDVDREVLQKQVESIEVRLNDGRTISADQRKKIFALIRDISFWCGHEPEYLRQYLTWEFCAETGNDWFSLSDVDVSTAKAFIDFIVRFCLKNNVPVKGGLLEKSEDIGKYLYHCIETRKCAICNKRASLHRMRFLKVVPDGDDYYKPGYDGMALCQKHHEDIHNGESDFMEKHRVYGIKLDEFLCTMLDRTRECDDES